MKREFENPIIKVEKFRCENIITVSGNRLENTLKEKGVTNPKTISADEFFKTIL